MGSAQSAVFFPHRMGNAYFLKDDPTESIRINQVASQLQLKPWLQLLQRKDIQKTDLFLPREWRSVGGACSSTSTLQLAFPRFEYLLEQQIAGRRSTNSFYSQHQLWFLLKRMAKTAAFFQPANEKLGCFAPSNILLNRQGRLKLISKYSSPLQISNFQVLIGKQKSFTPISPQQLSKLRSKEFVCKDLNYSLCDSFCLGLVVLEAATLTHTQEIYDLSAFTVNYQLIAHRISTLAKYYSRLLQELLALMLRPNSEERASCGQVEALLAPYQLQIDSLQNFLPSYDQSMDSLLRLKHKTFNYSNPARRGVISDGIFKLTHKMSHRSSKQINQDHPPSSYPVMSLASQQSQLKQQPKILQPLANHIAFNGYPGVSTDSFSDKPEQYPSFKNFKSLQENQFQLNGLGTSTPPMLSTKSLVYNQPPLPSKQTFSPVTYDLLPKPQYNNKAQGTPYQIPFVPMQQSIFQSQFTQPIQATQPIQSTQPIQPTQIQSTQHNQHPSTTNLAFFHKQTPVLPNVEPIPKQPILNLIKNPPLQQNPLNPAQSATSNYSPKQMNQLPTQQPILFNRPIFQSLQTQPLRQTPLQLASFSKGQNQPPSSPTKQPQLAIRPLQTLPPIIKVQNSLQRQPSTPQGFQFKFTQHTAQLISKQNVIVPRIQKLQGPPKTDS